MTYVSHLKNSWRVFELRRSNWRLSVVSHQVATEIVWSKNEVHWQRSSLKIRLVKTYLGRRWNWWLKTVKELLDRVYMAFAAEKLSRDFPRDSFRDSFRWAGLVDGLRLKESLRWNFVPTRSSQKQEKRRYYSKFEKRLQKIREVSREQNIRKCEGLG